MEPRRSHCPPFLVAGDAAVAMPRKRFDDRELAETHYQELLYKNPCLIPVHEIEPVFGPLTAVARELQVGAGRLDLLFMNPEGYLTLVETKLWRNPESRRDVVAQIIEYAAAMSGWTYADLRDAVEKARRSTRAATAAIGSTTDPLQEPFCEHGDFDEARFVDGIERTLREGRFLLLIVGDGIQEGVERLAEVLQAAPHLRFALALVEAAVYQMPEGDARLLVHPRVLARTTEIVRHVIEIRNLHNAATVRVEPAESADATTRRAGRSITESEFYRQLKEACGEPAADFAQWFVERVNQTPQLRLTWSPEGPALQWDDSNEEVHTNFLRLQRSGQLSATNGLPGFCAREGLPRSISDRFQDELVRLIPGARRDARGTLGYTHLVGSSGELASFLPLIHHRDKLWQIITDTATALEQAIAGKHASVTA